MFLVLFCTFIGAAAQLLMKSGGNQLAGRSLAELAGDPTLVLGNLPLIAGYVLYGCTTILFVMALRSGELSLLYPIIALTYVWVTVLSFAVLRESINGWKIAGILIIIAGVSSIGRDGKA